MPRPNPPTYDLRLDYAVFSADGEHLGYVGEIRRDAFKVDAPWARDYWVSFEHIHSVDPGGPVTLDLDADDVGGAKRQAPPRTDYSPNRARAYGETWRGTPGMKADHFPDYYGPPERIPHGVVYQYWPGTDEERRRELRQARRANHEDEIEPPPQMPGGASTTREEDDVPWREDRQLTDESEATDYAGTGRYSRPPGPAGNFPRYDQERGWGHQGQGGWVGRFGAPGTYSEPLGSIGFGGEDRAEVTGEPGRGYDADVWGYRQRGEAPRGYTGRGPRAYRRADSVIREDICERLTEAGDVDATDIEVDVKGGEVTLRGRVDTRFQKRRAEDLALDVSGVKDVHNRVRAVTAGTAKSTML